MRGNRRKKLIVDRRKALIYKTFQQNPITVFAPVKKVLKRKGFKAFLLFIFAVNKTLRSLNCLKALIKNRPAFHKSVSWS